MTNTEELSVQEYLQLIIKAKKHPVYKAYLGELNKVAPDFMMLIIRFNMDIKFPEHFDKMAEIGNHAIDDFAFGLIDEKEYEKRLMGMIPIISEVYPLCIQTLSEDELKIFREMQTNGK